MMDSVDFVELEKEFKQQIHRCKGLLESSNQDDLIVKAHLSSRSAVSLLQKLESGEEKKKEGKTRLLQSALHSFSQSVLDLTYYHESALANSEFSSDSSLDAIVEIIQKLSLPVRLCGPPGGLARLLGTELLECLYWRVGAMLYMFCYSLHEKAEKKESIDKELFLECCSAGVCHLRLMLGARAPLRDEEDFVANDMDMVRLLKQGIFSDIHMLALMYCGDMCYWMWETSSPSGKDAPTASMSKTETQAKDVQDSVATGKGMETNKCKESKEGKGQDNADAVIPSAKYADTPSVHSDSSHSTPPPDTACDKTDRENTRTDASEPISTSSAPSTTSMDEAVEKLESVELKSSETLEKNVTPSQELDQARKCKEKQGTSTQRTTHASDLYQLIQRAAGEGVMSRWVADFEPNKCGQEVLSKYIDAARGPLKGHGWEYSRAVKLMVKLKKADVLSTVK